MLAIRMQRTGRSGHAQFRLIVQDSHFHPTRGRVVAYMGRYDPHAKTASVDKQTAQKYLDSGAQPSDRAAKILQAEGVKLPGWYKPSAAKQRAIKNADKLRRNRPAEAEKPADAVEASTETVESTEEVASEQPTEEVAPEAPSEEPQAEETPSEPVKEEPKAEETPTEDTPQEAPVEAPSAEPAEQESTDQAA